MREVVKEKTLEPNKSITTLEVARAEVEWEYPMDIAAALDDAIIALNKQVPREHIRNEVENIFLCPVCKALVRHRQRYCARCGQALSGWE
ncbi:MAG: hypothetical protein IKO32_11200 [Lachnospiraceae bacterium]|nr:hypothetical protein [Lachnospiraceae bacterium]